MAIVHHHLIYQAHVGNNELGTDSEKVLEQFLYDLLKEIEMKCLIQAQLKLSHQKAWTGIVGIITSHKAIKFLNDFWKASDVRALFIDREVGKKFKIEEL
ncbi:hypothetical protein J4434_05010 [Candidatus Woesearchaeota archaeon]|nr:hypothetical protein [Candidatus Woesearchaeota archaeon]